MRMRSGFDPDSSLWDLTAVCLRQLRLTHGWSLAAVGDVIERDRSLVSYVESGDTRLRIEHAQKLDEAWNTDGLLSSMVRFAKSGHNAQWFKAHQQFQAKSTELRIWETSWVPGLFQTPEYARAVFECYGLEDIDKPLTARLKRQGLLDRLPRPLIWAYVYEDVIESPVGGPEVMRAQLARLLELAERPNITIRVLPRSVGATVGRDGAFMLMATAKEEQAFTEASAGGRLTDDSTDVSSLRVKFARIGDHALPVDASLRLIRESMEKFQ
ncbi:hypothetical protein BTM25_38050 [Actinomadura rubteroloni]|uniref:HTH cro/C1-type domain-containing protein n=1 Tax=Actinomadura rubteroloni TaxID=1926885 RepID=A0A2P4UJC5_9ACTN|nr:helix-turn-helix transcriptional regulator [Actinomadura rubteroloni]POM25162.1 hypothetical protein BTM25_38050 [Actinomadura rubteroloni]